jgi:hypothetical protein
MHYERKQAQKIDMSDKPINLTPLLEGYADWLAY